MAKIAHQIAEAAYGVRLYGRIIQSAIVAEVMATKMIRNRIASDLLPSLVGRN
jgi:hypothetical protein